jgi:hypothetical protein
LTGILGLLRKPHTPRGLRFGGRPFGLGFVPVCRVTATYFDGKIACNNTQAGMATWNFTDIWIRDLSQRSRVPE